MNVLGLNDSPKDCLIKMAEGNIGALQVLMKLITEQEPYPGLIDIYHLDDREIRGSKIWLGYKDVCKNDLSKFREMARDRQSGLESLIANAR